MGTFETNELHKAAAGIFDSLPEDPFGSEETEPVQEPAGDQQEDSGDEDDFDEEATAALTDEEPEDDEESDEGLEDDEYEEEESEEHESEDGEEDEDGADDDSDPLVSVRVDGETREIPLSEALAGYSRTASWTQKSQALANERREFQAEQAQVQQERSEYGAKLQAIEEQLGVNLPQEPDPNDPNYERKWIEHQREQQKLVRVQQERFALQQKMNEDFDRQRRAQIAESDKLLVEAIPEWQDEDVKKVQKASLATYATQVMGFDEEDVGRLVDHRLVLLLQKAAAYDSIQDAKTTVKGKVKKAPVLKPGQSNRKSSSKAKKAKRTAKTKRAKLKRDGGIHDAADYIFDTLEDF